jgi:hypothetical protein
VWETDIVAIEFHCEHCSSLIRASEDSAGRTGKCPHCGSETYIPRPVEEADELPLAPLDEEDERRRRQAAAEDAAYQRKLLEDRATPGEKPGGAKRRETPAAPEQKSERPSSKQLTRYMVQYLEAMSAGQLPRAAELVREMTKYRSQVLSVLEAMETEDLAGYGLPPLPRPVLIGFLKQLRTQL